MDRLFVYGSLQPGGPNEHVLASVEGNWEPGVIAGKLVDAGWGAGMGYPGLVIDGDGNGVPGYVFSSPDLQSMWAELDQLEGSDYERTIAEVALADGSSIRAHVYVLRA